MKNKRLIALIICIVTVITSLPVISIGSFADDVAATIITGSDFQPKDGSVAGIARVRKILNKIIMDGVTKADGFLFCGDYDFSTHGVAEETKEGVNALTSAFKSIVDKENMVFLQGNHDTVVGTMGLSESGNNDPKHGKYGVYVINQEDYMWYNSDEARIKKTTQRLINYLNEKIAIGYDKPIFVMSHLPLHYTMRTRLEGDAKYANYIFDALNQAGKQGLNIIFLFGHDHSNGWDDYLGGSSVYLAKGDTIQIAQKSQSYFKKETLNFTYMNAGYTGYYDNNNGADATLTLCCITISTSGEVTVKRYSKDGVHNLKAEGKTNKYKGESGYDPDTTVYTSPQIIAPTKVTNTTPIKDIMELNEEGRVYTRINNVSELKDGEKYLLVYNSSTDKIMLPQVVEKNNSSGTRIGFELEASSVFGENVAYGEFADKEWTFVKSGNGWKLCYDGKYVKLTDTTDKKITATLEDNGNVFTISGESGFIFKTGSYSFNYNARDLINAYTSDPASFYIYKYSGYSINLKNAVATVDGQVVTSAFEGQSVTIKADPAPKGHSFYRWEFNNQTNITLEKLPEDSSSLTSEYSAEVTFTMPAAAVKLTATYFTDEPSPTVIPNDTETGTEMPDETPEAPIEKTNSAIIVYIAVGVGAVLVAGAVVFVILANDKKKAKK